MKRFLLLSVFIAITINTVDAMCGCMFPMVPPSQTQLLADLQLYNESSKVILVRDGDKTVVTMANDFKGKVKDFALVIPVPEVLKEDDIRIVKSELFDQFNRMTAPQYTRNFDMNPCGQVWGGSRMFSATAESVSDSGTGSAGAQQSETGSVKIEARYSIGEYDILVLSSEESAGLTKWLEENGYGIPSEARDVVEPYVKSGMKFLVAKVNLEKQTEEFAELNPLQLAFNTDRFVLPIRFGMANAEGDQDMVVYGLTRNGRMEATNYRTVNMPSGHALPEFIGDKFDAFYSAAFETAWKREGGNAIFLEYAGNRNQLRLFPVDQWGNPTGGSNPKVADQTYRDAGVFWLDGSNDVYVTRLHIRYNRERWAQDIQFQTTPNTSIFHVNFPIQQIATGNFDCNNAKGYLNGVAQRRQKDLHSLAHLTGWDIKEYDDYPDVWTQYDIKKSKKDNFAVPTDPVGGTGGLWLLLIPVVIGIGTQVPFDKIKTALS